MSDPQSPYVRIGEADGIRRLVDAFYDAMEQQSEVRPLLEMHPEDTTSSRDKLFAFLSGWMGGPPLFHEAYGHPRLRMRHARFAIDRAARDQWMHCMSLALDETVADVAFRSWCYERFGRVADHMMNR